MALLLLQALPSPLSARAEPPQVRGRGCPGRCGDPGVVEAWLEGSEVELLPSVEESHGGRPCLAWAGAKGAPVFSRGTPVTVLVSGRWQRHGAKRVRGLWDGRYAGCIGVVLRDIGGTLSH